MKYCNTNGHNEGIRGDSNITKRLSILKSLSNRNFKKLISWTGPLFECTRSISNLKTSVPYLLDFQIGNYYRSFNSKLGHNVLRIFLIYLEKLQLLNIKKIILIITFQN